MNEQISLMGLSVLRRLLCDIRRAQCFSLILDEATGLPMAVMIETLLVTAASIVPLLI